MTDDKPTDYAALIRAANAATPDFPDWLKPGNRVRSPHYGVGEVISLLGKRLIVKFPGYSVPVMFKDWLLSVQAGEVHPEQPATITPETSPDEVPEPQTRVSPAQIKAIPRRQFQMLATELAESLTAVKITLPSTGELYPIPQDIPRGLHAALNQIGINHLYSHQVEALTSLRLGKDLSLVTPTASGKTLCYNLAILESCLNQPRMSALYIFPLKALAFDQMRKLQQMIADSPIKVGLMTGDTPKNERQRLFAPNPPNILAVSPDLLHHQLYHVRRCSEGEPWREFLRQLRWVVIDESHTYVGAFGAHFANVMRRLRLAVDSVGGNSNRIQFICSSATVGNPEEMALSFSGRTHQTERLHLIQRSGADSAGRTLLCLAPSSTPNPDACKIIISWLQHDLGGIVFCNSRAAVKSLMGLVQRETQRQNLGNLAKRVAVFYGSLKGERRREIIQQLQQGRVKVILSTSALEAGIDLPELDCCLVRGYPGSLMSFWQRLGRAGRFNHGLVVFLPVAQNPLDAFYGRYPEQLLSKEVESATFNPDYPTILSKHLECSCVESGVPLVEVQDRFSQAAGAIADELLQQNKLYLGRDSKLWGRERYPHKYLNLRSSTQNSIDLIDKCNGEAFQTMSLALAQREVFPGAIYMVQDTEGELIAYRSESLNTERGEAVLTFLSKDSDLLTKAESHLDIELLSVLAEPKIIPTGIPSGRLRLTLAWGEIIILVTGYQLLKKDYGLTCTNRQCCNYHQPLQGKACSSCKRTLRSAEITKVKQEVKFEQPYKTQYQAPCVKVEVNQSLWSALQAQMREIKHNIKALHGDDIPGECMDLWTCAPEFIALHSMEHQLVKAVPLVVLSSSLDVDCVVETAESNTVGYFFDTCDGGNGAAEAIFHQLPKFAAKALALAQACDCSSGCPRCLTQHGCTQHNLGLHKDTGLFLLDAIVQGSQQQGF